MDVLDINKKAWNAIGASVASPYQGSKNGYMEKIAMFSSRLPQGGSVLDVGCGPGLPFTKMLVEQGFKVTGLDIAETMIENARANVPQAEYVVASITELDMSNAFDGVFSSYSLLCLSPEQFKEACSRIANSLRPGGIFFISVNEPGPEGHDESENIHVTLGQTMYSRAYTEKEILDIVTPLGFEVVECHRETTVSEAYGEEHTLVFILRLTNS